MPKKNRRPRRRTRGRQRSKAARPINLVMSLDGSPLDEPCACPVCADLARSGVPVMTLDARGNLVEVAPPPVLDMIDVVVRGTASTWPEIPDEARTVSVPRGCVVQDLMEYLRHLDDGLQQAFPPGALTARLGGVSCPDERVVEAGDEYRVSGVRDPRWTGLVATPAPWSPGDGA